MPDVHHFNALDTDRENDLRPPQRLLWTGQRESRTLLQLAHCALKHTKAHPPALAFVPPSFIASSSGIFPRHPDHLLFLPVISVPASSPRHSVYFVLLLWLQAFCGLLGLFLSLSLISISQFLILDFSQSRSQQPHRGETILLWQQKKSFFAIKMDDLLSIMFCFSVSSSFWIKHLLTTNHSRTEAFYCGYLV